MKIDRQAIQDLAGELGRPIGTLLALVCANDPFYLSEGRLRDAEWFASIYGNCGFGSGVHLRRIHYRLISTTAPILLPSGEAYENTERHWNFLCAAAKGARYAELVPIEDFVDRRNPRPTVRLADMPAPPTFQVWQPGSSSLDELKLSHAPFTHFPALQIEGGTLPALFLPALSALNGKPSQVQPYHLELWAEKTTIADILEEIAGRHRLNVVFGLGELSLTACQSLISRIRNNGSRPVRLLYLSDFDPAGQSMPVAIARKIEWLVRNYAPEVDIQVRPILLTYEQCVRYPLPRTPIKETERRAASFEARFGEGATELDALEALHPGELRRIIEREIGRYYLDQDELNGWADRVAEDTNAKLFRATEAAHAERADEIEAITAEFEAIAERADELRARAEDAIEPFAERYERLAVLSGKIMERAETLREEMEAAIEPINAQYQIDVIEAIESLQERARPVFASIADDLRQRGEAVVANLERLEIECDQDDDPLYDSRRDYVRQIDRYKRFQDKPIAGKRRGRPAKFEGDANGLP